jgi:glucose-6-phosphate isomerase
MTQGIRISISGARSAAVGREHGVTPSELKALEPVVAQAHRALRAERSQKKYGFYDLHKDKAILGEVQRAAKGFSKARPQNLVVLGIGGSALGTTALVTALKPPYYNLLSEEERGGRPRVFVMDNVDPETFHQMMRICPPEKTLYNVISKSGGTAETVAQLLVVVDLLEKAVGASALKEHLVVTTGALEKGAKPNPLQALVKKRGLVSFDVPPNVGGRFSVFSSVGLFPAAVLGMDLKALFAGCASMDKQCSRANLLDNPAYLRAAVNFLGSRDKGKSISVMLPYADALRDVADWYCQIWAESLGKRCNLDGTNTAWHAGQTPVKALGVTDQHSQLQLYLEGPNDKVITVLSVAAFRKRVSIPKAGPSVKGPAYLHGSTLNKLMAAERKATVDSLKENDRPVMAVNFPQVNEFTVAELLYMLEVETAMAGRLFDVDAFDQPAVEQIKVRTRRNMGAKS